MFILSIVSWRSGQNSTAFRKIFLVEKSSSRLFSVQETIWQLGFYLVPLLEREYAEEIRDVTEFRFYFF